MKNSESKKDAPAGCMKRLVRLAFDALSEDISDRRGLKWEWTKVDDDVMEEEIRPAWEAIISECVSKHLESLDGECVVDHRDGYQYAGPFKDDGAAREWIALQPNREQLRLVMNAKIPLPNVKEHATLSARASVDHGIKVKTTERHVNRAADRGCCVSICSAIFLNMFWSCLNRPENQSEKSRSS